MEQMPQDTAKETDIVPESQHPSLDRVLSERARQLINDTILEMDEAISKGQLAQWGAKGIIGRYDALINADIDVCIGEMATAETAEEYAALKDDLRCLVSAADTFVPKKGNAKTRTPQLDAETHRAALNILKREVGPVVNRVATGKNTMDKMFASFESVLFVNYPGYTSDLVTRMPDFRSTLT